MKNATLNRHRAGLLHKVEASNKRGAALILEIIIYLVIVALIAVAVTSGVRAIRDLVFTSHAKGDIQNVQTWVEGKYTQDNVYPNVALTNGGTGDLPTMTTANNVTNQFAVTSTNGATSSYCIKVTSNSISDASKHDFWVASNNPAKIMQLGTATHPGGATATAAPTTAQTGVAAACPAA